MPLSVTACTTIAQRQHEHQERHVHRTARSVPPRCAAAEAAHRQHRGAGQRRPGRGHPQRFGDREAGQRQRQHHQDEHRRPRRVPRRRRRSGATRRSRAKNNRNTTYTAATAASHGNAISRGEPRERQIGDVKGQQVGQIRHRKQQRGGVGQVGGGVAVRPHRGPQPTHGDQHHRGQQHHRGVQAECGGDDGGDGEHLPQQAVRPGAHPSHRRARGLEQALVVAQLGQHQHRAQKRHHRRQPGNLRPRLMDRDRADRDQYAAAGTAATASGQPRGRATANPSTDRKQQQRNSITVP